MYGCGICGWYGCFKCYMKVRDKHYDQQPKQDMNNNDLTNIKCKMDHKLVSFNCQKDGTLCNICNNYQLKEMPMKGCNDNDSSECGGWNVCYNCYYLYNLKSEERYDEHKKEEINGLFEDENESINILMDEIEKYHNENKTKTDDNGNDAVLRFPKKLHAPWYWAVLFQAFKYPNERMIDVMDNILIPLLDKSIAEQKCYFEPVYSFWCSWYIVSNQATGRIKEDMFFDDGNGYSWKVYNSIKDLLAIKKGDFSKHEKKFIKSMLGWWYTKNKIATQFSSMQKIAKEAMEELQQPLIEAYDKLFSEDIPLENLLDVEQFAIGIKKNGNIKCQNDLHPHLIQQKMDIWIKSAQFNDNFKYKNKNKMIYECGLLSDWLQNQGLNSDGLYDYYQKHSVDDERDNIEYEYELSDNYFGLYYYFEIAKKINDDFQNDMFLLFNKNRKKMGLEEIKCLNHQTNIGVTSAPIKKFERSFNKCKRDYSTKNYSRAGYILDYVRCAMIVKDVDELLSLIKTICVEYKDDVVSIARMKNRFDRDSKSSFGYKSIMLNIIYCGKTNPNLYRLICEIQITSIDFLKARKFMHLYYKIIRAENTWDLALDAGAAS